MIKGKFKKRRKGTEDETKEKVKNGDMLRRWDKRED